jgi:uncharacterized protein (DUF58 family)
MGSARTGSLFPGWPPQLSAALNRLSLAVRRRARSPYAGAVRSVSRGRALEFAAHRPYTPGDDPRLIDWRAYSRLDRVFLKQFDEERARRVTLLLDASASMGALGPDDDAPDAHKGLFARRLAAALAWVALGRGDGVRAVLLKSGRAETLPPVGSRAGVGALFDALSSVREDGGVGLGGAVRAALASLPPGTAGPVLLISDLLRAAACRLARCARARADTSAASTVQGRPHARARSATNSASPADCAPRII